MLSPSSIAWRRHAGREDRAGWHTAWLSRVPRQFARAAQRQYNALLFAERLDDGDARRAANYHVQEVRDHFDGLAGALDLTASDSEIRDTAKQIVEQILSMRRLHQGHDFEAFLNEITLFLAEREVYLSDSEDAGECATLLPKLGKRGVTHETVYKRLTDEGFWRRALFRTITRKGEAESIRAGLVNQKASLYVSDETLARFRTRRCRNRELLESLIAVNELGEKFTLAELADVSVSNPELRRAELMTRIVGFETIAKALGHAGLFLTITCPSRFHAFRKLKHGKVVQKNAAYGGATPRDAQRYLSGVFSRIRSQLLRRGIAPYGFRIAEPHHDGCPHWHLLLFVPQHQATEMVEVFRDHATKADREELARTGDDPRFRAIAIDWQRGSAAGYVSKYICKNIDGRKATGEPIGLNFD
ncbi:replication endonuclease, partial [Chitinimonas sp.]|uniref:replication endonuclease n=1 Tax=Chitinimonas sp. TaxID=1934313 RepID=UPI0035B24E86